MRLHQLLRSRSPGLRRARALSARCSGGLAWYPFWLGSNALIAWGINAIIFPVLTGLYELSLLVRRERHPVGIRQIATPAALFGAVVAFVVVRDYTGAPSALAHPIWQGGGSAG
jgi:peptidoglycan/LPS O-acetylase OafA/YrhL